MALNKFKKICIRRRERRDLRRRGAVRRAIRRGRVGTTFGRRVLSTDICQLRQSVLFDADGLRTCSSIM